MKRTAALITALWLLFSISACSGGDGMETAFDPEKAVWTADPNSGCEVWNPLPQPDETIAWDGPCQYGKAEGKGILVFYENGLEKHRYLGELRGGYLQGQVVYTTPDGYRFEGLYEKDRKVKGVETYDGYRYEGEFADDAYEGYGVLTYPDGRVEKGVWKNGRLVEPK